MKVTDKIIVGILMIWAIWIGYQYFTKSKAARMLLENEVKKILSSDFNYLLRKVKFSRDYEFKEVKVEGKKYWMGWVFVRPDSCLKCMAFHLSKPHLGEKDKVRLIEDVNSLKGCIYVDYIEILPFAYLKSGLSKILLLEKR